MGCMRSSYIILGRKPKTKKETKPTEGCSVAAAADDDDEPKGPLRRPGRRREDIGIKIYIK
jgi:hypothetical protein